MLRKTVLILLLAGAVLADEDEREYAQTKADLRLKVARRVVEDARELVVERERLFQVGAGSVAELDEARHRFVEAEAHLKLRQLEMEEVKATGRSPNGSITAPLVGKRDFVMGRLEIEHHIARSRDDALHKMSARAEHLFKKNAMSKAGAMEAKAEAQVAGFAVDRVRHMMRLRKRFFDPGSGTGADEAEMSVFRFDAEFRMKRAKALLPVAEERRNDMRAGLKAGTSSRAALREAERAVLELQVEFEIARMDFGYVTKKLSIR